MVQRAHVGALPRPEQIVVVVGELRRDGVGVHLSSFFYLFIATTTLLKSEQHIGYSLSTYSYAVASRQ